jgi:hypothetical protein
LVQPNPCIPTCLSGTQSLPFSGHLYWWPSPPLMYWVILASACYVPLWSVVYCCALTSCTAHLALLDVLGHVLQELQITSFQIDRSDQIRSGWIRARRDRGAGVAISHHSVTLPSILLINYGGTHDTFPQFDTGTGPFSRSLSGAPAMSHFQCLGHIMSHTLTSSYMSPQS